MGGGIGGGGGAAGANNAISSGTVDAACQPAIPCRHTRDAALKVPAGIICCNIVTGNGPSCCPLSAT